ncbi:MAG: response regulator [Chitinophagaceae bacterium]|nr:response regulator [Chitinophagaceae bacterium]
MIPDGPYVMIIDDEVSLCDLLSTMLYTKGVNVSCVYSLAEAEAYIRNKQPFIIFLDNHLPDGYGIDFLSKMKTEFPKLKFVMITGDYNEELKQQALTEGCIGFLEKPFSYLRVSELLQEAMETANSHR